MKSWTAFWIFEMQPLKREVSKSSPISREVSSHWDLRKFLSSHVGMALPKSRLHHFPWRLGFISPRTSIVIRRHCALSFRHRSIARVTLHCSRVTLEQKSLPSIFSFVSAWPLLKYFYWLTLITFKTMFHLKGWLLSFRMFYAPLSRVEGQLSET